MEEPFLKSILIFSSSPYRIARFNFRVLFSRWSFSFPFPNQTGFVAFPNHQTRFTSWIAFVESSAERLKVLTEDQSRYSSR
ncbi:hypothetical protein P8452_57054 [Trifolium repens]|nr:hypothetical protein P8452_57054 [Trifolium repens]